MVPDFKSMILEGTWFTGIQSITPQTPPRNSDRGIISGLLQDSIGVKFEYTAIHEQLAGVIN